MKQKTALLLALALVLAVFPAAMAEEYPQRYSVDAMKALTWDEASPYYDNVCFVYNNTEDPFEDYSITCLYPDMTNPMTFEAEKGTVVIEVGLMGSYDTVLPYIQVDCVGDFFTLIKDVRLDCGVTLTMHFDEQSEMAAAAQGESYAMAVSLGSNVFTLMRALAESKTGLHASIVFADGSTAEGQIPAEATAIWSWYWDALHACGLLDADDRVQEELRLEYARLQMSYQGDPSFTLEGAETISDANDSVTAQPLKLEYAESLANVPQGFFNFGVINYNSTFVQGSDTEITGFDLVWTAVDAYGKAIPLANGETQGTVHYDQKVTPGGMFSATVDAGLPAEAQMVLCQLTAYTCGDGTVVTIPERDLVTVEYLPGGVDLEQYIGV